MKKMRHVREGKFGEKEYFIESTTEEVSEYLKIRLEMKDIGNNQGKARKCKCEEEESIEHLLKCAKINQDEGGNNATIEDFLGERLANSIPKLNEYEKNLLKEYDSFFKILLQKSIQKVPQCHTKKRFKPT